MMDNLARKLEAEAVLQEVGTVVAIHGKTSVIRTAAGTLDADRAVSCLVAPREGDRVLVAGSRREGFYVLAILTREEGAGASLCVDGDLEVRVPSGRFVVAAQEGVALASGKEVSIAAENVQIRAVRGEVAVGALSLLGSLLRAEIGGVKLLAERVDSVVERVSQRIKSSLRTVEESDHLRAARIDYAASSTMSLHGKSALVTAEELVKVDGEQIHVG